MRISIIIPVYNIERYIVRCLDSVVSHGWETTECECIIVDDAGTDKSLDIAERYVRDYHGPVSFRIEKHRVNMGLSATRNTGLDYASGDYVFFLDGDDEIAPGGINRLVSLAKKYPGVDIVQGNIEIPHDKYQTLELSQYCDKEYTDDREWLRRNMFHNLPVTAWNKLTRLGFIRENGLRFKEGIIHEDNHWMLQMYRNIRSMAFCYTSTYIYHLNSDSIMENRYKDRSYMSLLEIYSEFLPSMDRPDEQGMAVSEMARLYMHMERLENSDKFMKRYVEVFSQLLTLKNLNWYTRRACHYAINRSKVTKRLARVFCRPLYRLLKDCDRL